MKVTPIKINIKEYMHSNEYSWSTFSVMNLVKRLGMFKYIQEKKKNFGNNFQLDYVHTARNSAKL